MRHLEKALFISLALALGPAPLDPRPAFAAENDNDVEWFGVYANDRFRSPERPAPRSSFDVFLRTYRGDLTSARVRAWDGAEKHFPMRWLRNEGAAYDIWVATLSGLDSDVVYYRFELVDGSDRDYYNRFGMSDGEPAGGDFRVDLTPLGRYLLGATPAQRVTGPGLPASGVVFRVWAPNATSAAVAGEFNGWSRTVHPMADYGGVWEAQVPVARAGHEYKFVFDDAIWRTDPRARLQTSSVGNSVVVDSGIFAWSDGDWVTPYFEDMIIYELHVGSFSGEGDGVPRYPGDFRDLVDVHVDHLVDLGINMVELLPVCEFAGDRSWGYNPSFLYAVEESYGGPDGLRYLIDRLHRRGIGVLIDVVYNHMGGTDLAGNLLDYDGDEIYFYTNGYRDTPWGPRPDYGRREVRDLILDNLVYWLEEFHVDGFRLDGTAFVDVNVEGWSLLQDIARTVDSVAPKAIVIAEHLPNDPFVTRSIDIGGAGIDAQWNDAFHDNLRAAIGAAAFGDPSMASIAAGIDHFALGSGTQVVQYIESHDEAAVHGRVPVAADGADPSSVWAAGRSRVALALTVLSAGIPMILQGEEWLESRPFGDGREHRIQWRLADENRGFLAFARTLFQLRREQPALRSSSAQNVFHVNDGAEVLAFQRWTAAGGDLVVVTSLANDDFDAYRLGFPQPGTWYEIVNGAAEMFGGRDRGKLGSVEANGAPRDGFGQSATLVIPRMGVLVFARAPWSIPDSDAAFIRGDANGDGALDLSDAVFILAELFLGGARATCRSATDVNADAAVDLSDAVYGLSYLFLGGPAPRAPFPACAAAASELDCKSPCAP